MKITKNIKYVFSNKIRTPITIGIINKKIIIPKNFEISDYKYIMKHELFHFKNKDVEFKFICLILESIYFFNPIIKLLTKEINEIIELNCDYNILEKEDDLYRKEYGNILLKQIEFNRNKQYKLVTNFASSRRNIMDRFKNILNGKSRKNSITISCVFISFIIISVLAIIFVPDINIATTEENNKMVLNEENVNMPKIAEESKDKNVNNPEVVKENDIEEINKEVILEQVENNNIDECNKVTKKVENTDKIVKDNVSVNDKKKVFPLTAEYRITANFQEKLQFSEGKSHTGIDFATKTGEKILAVMSGKVISSGFQAEYGKYIIIDHGNGFTTKYSHCSKILKEQGELVNAGDVIAEVGNTGMSTGPHLHFEVKKDGTFVDPTTFLP